jgi:hypothetical protein
MSRADQRRTVTITDIKSSLYTNCLWLPTYTYRVFRRRRISQRIENMFESKKIEGAKILFFFSNKP